MARWLTLLVHDVNFQVQEVAAAPEQNSPHQSFLDARIFYMAYIMCFMFAVFALFFQILRSICTGTPTSKDVASALEDADMPIVIYVGDPAAAKTDGGGDDTDDACSKRQPEECTVCLQEFVAGQEVRVMRRCRHMFHRQCIDEWLQSGPSGTCPNCRDVVIGKEADQ